MQLADHGELQKPVWAFFIIFLCIMGLIATAGSSEKRELLEPGKYDAVCIGIIDLGSQEVVRENEKKTQRKVQILFELCGKTYEREGETYPMVRSKKYTLSMHEKGSLRKDLKGWYGKDQGDSFDLANTLGKTAEITIIHEKSKDGNEYETINYIGMSNHSLKPLSKTIEYYIDEHSDVVFEKLSKRTKETIEKSPEYKAMKKKQDDDLLPF